MVISAIKDIEKNIFETAKTEFNISSSKDLGEILFEKLELPGGKKDEAKGTYDVTTKVLENLNAQGHEICGKVLEWKFVRKIPNLVKKITEDQDRAEVSRKLVSLCDDIEVVTPLEEFAVREPDGATLLAFLKEQEFKSLISKMESRGFHAHVLEEDGGKVADGNNETTKKEESAGYELKATVINTVVAL